MSSIGAEILCLIAPEDFLVKLRCGIEGAISDALADLLVVKALERDIFAEAGRIVTSGPDKMEALLPFRQKVRWLSTAVNGGVKLSESVICADRLGGCVFACVGLAGGQQCAASLNDAVVVLLVAPEGPGM